MWGEEGEDLWEEGSEDSELVFLLQQRYTLEKSVNRKEWHTLGKEHSYIFTSKNAFIFNILA